MPFEAGFEVLSWLDPISLGPFSEAEEGGDRHLENFEETSFLARNNRQENSGREIQPFSEPPRLLFRYRQVESLRGPNPIRLSGLVFVSDASSEVPTFRGGRAVG